MGVEIRLDGNSFPNERPGGDYSWSRRLPDLRFCHCFVHLGSCQGRARGQGLTDASRHPPSDEDRALACPAASAFRISSRLRSSVDTSGACLFAIRASVASRGRRTSAALRKSATTEDSVVFPTEDDGLGPEWKTPHANTKATAARTIEVFGPAKFVIRGWARCRRACATLDAMAAEWPRAR